MNSIRKGYSCNLPNGSEVTLSVDKERFHSCEVLFTPSVFDGEGGSAKERGIVQTIIAAVSNIDEIVREEMCSKIVICGRSGLIPGLLARLQKSITPQMTALGVKTFSLILAEESQDVKVSVPVTSHTLPSEGFYSPTAVWRGASARVRRAVTFPIEEQNFVTYDDYNEYGPSLIQDLIVG
jgi:actin-related protein